ncbi:MAG: ATP-dependent DNA helicase RecQ [Planctomycetes bacterium]|nr:ATP-dependent DNA helicase RecQ [Planctomycetota bacterium]
MTVTADHVDVIAKHWGIRAFRPLQLEAIEAGLAGRDSFVVMPTGGGKSLCFQAPALMRDGLTVVVCPLISLMIDQVVGLVKRGVPAAYLNCKQHPDEVDRIHRDARQGRIKLLYVSAERCMEPAFLRLLERCNVCAFVIDEAHCVSQWGHDFRPAYRELGALTAMFPEASLHAFTASATPDIREEIIASLKLRDPVVLVGNFDRPNLTYRVEPRTDLDSQLFVFLRDRPDASGIIYCTTRAETDRIADMLRDRDINAKAYHAGCDDDLRHDVQEWFMDSGPTSAQPSDLQPSNLESAIFQPSTIPQRIVVATIAFGMGIDRPDVRFVIHAAMPPSIECYHQETGRAGRDGKPAECVLFYDPTDVDTWCERIANQQLPDDTESSKLADAVVMNDYCDNAGMCRHRRICEYFGQAWQNDPAGCYSDGLCNACDFCFARANGSRR